MLKKILTPLALIAVFVASASTVYAALDLTSEHEIVSGKQQCTTSGEIGTDGHIGCDEDADCGDNGDGEALNCSPRVGTGLPQTCGGGDFWFCGCGEGSSNDGQRHRCCSTVTCDAPEGMPGGGDAAGNCTSCPASGNCGFHVGSNSAGCR